VVGRLGVDGRVVVLQGSDRRLVFGRSVNGPKVLVFVLRYWNRSLLPQNVCQGSGERKKRNYQHCCFTPRHPPPPPTLSPRRFFIIYLATASNLSRRGTRRQRGNPNYTQSHKVQTRPLVVAGVELEAHLWRS